MLITPHLENILNVVKTNAVVSIVAPTGTGKSIGIPDILAANGYKCYVCVPTRTAAYSLCEYQKKIQKEKRAKISVGYAAEGNINYDNKTDIVYATSGHIRKKMLSHFENSKVADITFCNVLFVDESHIGSVDNRIILSLWRLAAKRSKKVPKLLIVSATPVEMFTDINVTNYTVDVKSLGVDIKYNNVDYSMGDNRLYRETAKKAINIHQTENIDKGHILIFAPGKSEINLIIDELANIEAADVLSAHGQLSATELNEIYKVSKKRKIIVATNVAEMSLTIDNVGFVIDTMTEKKTETSSNGGTKLVVSYISKDSAVQRAGRTGRTIKGVCYRMCTESFYNKLEDHRIEEIHRIPIHSPIIELLDAALNPLEVLPNLDKNKLNTTVRELSALGLTYVDTDKNITVVTDKGHFCVKFPLSVKNSAFLWSWMYGNKNMKINKAMAKKANSIFDMEKIDIGTSSFPDDIFYFEQILKENIDPSGGTLVISINEYCGEYSLQCLSHSENCTVLSINQDKYKCDIISYNLSNANSLILNSKTKNFETSVYNINPHDYFNYDRYATMVVLNVLTTDDIDLLIKILKNNCTTRIVAKVDLSLTNEFTNALTDTGPNIELNLDQYETENSNFFIISTQTQNSVNVIYDNVPNNYPEKKYRYPIYPGIVICSIIDTYGPSYFWKPKKEKDQTREAYNNLISNHRQEYYDDLVGYSDIETYINLWCEFQKQKNIKSWAKKRSVNLKKFNELIKNVDRCIITCEKYINDKIKIGPFTTKGSITVARTILSDVYKDNILTSKYANYVDKFSKTFILNSSDSINNYDFDGKPQALIALASTEIKSSVSGGSIHLFSLSLDIDYDVSKKYKANFYKPEIGNPQIRANSNDVQENQYSDNSELTKSPVLPDSQIRANTNNTQETQYSNNSVLKKSPDVSQFKQSPEISQFKQSPVVSQFKQSPEISQFKQSPIFSNPNNVQKNSKTENLLKETELNGLVDQIYEDIFYQFKQSSEVFQFTQSPNLTHCSLNKPNNVQN